MTLTQDGVSLRQSQLEAVLWSAASALRGLVAPGEFNAYVFPVLFFKIAVAGAATETVGAATRQARTGAFARVASSVKAARAWVTRALAALRSNRLSALLSDEQEILAMYDEVLEESAA